MVDSFLWFQVQVIFQRCSSNANCNCAVAVKSGDFVFVVDRCRRHGDSCQGNVSCGGLLRTSSYMWERVTPGTKIFRKNEGRAYEVSLVVSRLRPKHNDMNEKFHAIYRLCSHMGQLWKFILKGNFWMYGLLPLPKISHILWVTNSIWFS